MSWDNYKQPYRLPEKKRQAVLKRDNHLCQIRDEGCTIVGDVVDHVVSMKAAAQLGWTQRQIHGMSNLRASCRSCNAKKASIEGRVAQGNEVKAKRTFTNPGLSGPQRTPEEAREWREQQQREWRERHRAKGAESDSADN